MQPSHKSSLWVAASAATLQGPIKWALAPDAPGEPGLGPVYETDSFEFLQLMISGTLIRADAAGLSRLHFSGQISAHAFRYRLRRCRCSPWNPWRSHRSNETVLPFGR